MKTAELEGALLDYWVAKAAGLPLSPEWDQGDYIMVGRGDGDLRRWSPSLTWEHGGPIIERERIETGPSIEGNWYAEVDPYNYKWGADKTPTSHGPTPLIAAMRAYVASKYSEKVPDAPDVKL